MIRAYLEHARAAAVRGARASRIPVVPHPVEPLEIVLALDILVNELARHVARVHQLSDKNLVSAAATMNIQGNAANNQYAQLLTWLARRA